MYDLLPVSNPDFEGKGPDAGLNGPIWELDVDELHSVQVQGGLRQHIRFWIGVLNAPDRVVDAIQYGYVLPLFSLPTPYFGCNHLANCDFVSLAIQDNVETGSLLLTRMTH